MFQASQGVALVDRADLVAKCVTQQLDGLICDRAMREAQVVFGNCMRGLVSSGRCAQLGQGKRTVPFADVSVVWLLSKAGGGEAASHHWHLVLHVN
jgi:hypothetical protein